MLTGPSQMLGAPGFSSLSLARNLPRGFMNFNFGYASAISVLLFICPFYAFLAAVPLPAWWKDLGGNHGNDNRFTPCFQLSCREADYQDFGKPLPDRYGVTVRRAVRLDDLGGIKAHFGLFVTPIMIFPQRFTFKNFQALFRLPPPLPRAPQYIPALVQTAFLWLGLRPCWQAFSARWPVCFCQVQLPR
jgi:hypothetical protein